MARKLSEEKRIAFIPPQGIKIQVRDHNNEIYGWVDVYSWVGINNGWWPIEEILKVWGDNLNG